MTEREEEDFASMFEASLRAKRVERGQTIEGTVVAIGPEVAFVDVGGKGEATIDIDELKDDEGHLEVAVGDRVQAVVVSTAGGLTLSRKLARGAATDRQLADAFQSGLPVDGKVEKTVKGGYEIRIGRQRAFCPLSQMDLPRAQPAEHEGRVYTFRILEYAEGGRKFVVSRRAILEEEQRAAAEDVRRSIVPGAVLTGRVASVRDFGAFVDLGGGVQGLLHVSEMGWSRVPDAAEAFKPGDEITVKVLQVDEAKQDASGTARASKRERSEASSSEGPEGTAAKRRPRAPMKISLGLKQLTEDPWSRVAANYEVGQVRTGRVTRVLEFGAFVELEPGVEALAHASTFDQTRGARLWSSGIAPGMGGAFEILGIDVEKKRIGVKLVLNPNEADDVREYAQREDSSSGKGFGSLADKLRGALGEK